MQKIIKDPKEMTETEWNHYITELRKQAKLRSSKEAEKRKLLRHLQKVRDRRESARKRRRLGMIDSQVYLDLLKELTAHEKALVSRLNSLD